MPHGVYWRVKDLEDALNKVLMLRAALVGYASPKGVVCQRVLVRATEDFQTHPDWGNFRCESVDGSESFDSLPPSKAFRHNTLPW